MEHMIWDAMNLIWRYCNNSDWYTIDQMYFFPWIKAFDLLPQSSYNLCEAYFLIKYKFPKTLVTY